MMNDRLNALLLEALEHERGGLLVYQTAIQCAQNQALKEEWTKYLGETEEHARRLEDVCEQLQLDPDQATPVRPIVKDLGASLVRAMETALATATPADAEVVACECVVLAETKDHLNWELLSTLAEVAGAPEALQEACEDVEDQEDEHLYHSKGWCRELWLQALGQEAVLPPPEERRDARSAIGAARAEQDRDSMLGEPADGARENEAGAQA